jgi:hypothetical protein
MFFMPETPRFLVREGDEDEARDVLEELKSDDAPAEDEPDRKVEEIREVDEQEEGGGWELLKQPWIVRRSWWPSGSRSCSSSSASTRSSTTRRPRSRAWATAPSRRSTPTSRSAR